MSSSQVRIRNMASSQVRKMNMVSSQVRIRNMASSQVRIKNMDSSQVRDIKHDLQPEEGYRTWPPHRDEDKNIMTSSHLRDEKHGHQPCEDMELSLQSVVMDKERGFQLASLDQLLLT